jgi:hypothetical protein
MGTKSKSFAMILVALFLTSLIIFQPATAKSTILESNSLYTIPDENATIILLKGTSYGDTTNYYSAHNTTYGYVPSSWFFALFSTGNGTIGLTISAHDCNVTIISYNYYLTDMGDYYFRADSWLNYSVAGIGSQRLDYSKLFNSNNSNPNVYIDGIAREQGDGWDWANFGITVNDAVTTVSIHQEDTDYLPPRNPPHAEPIDYVLPVSVLLATIAIIILSAILYRRRRKPSSQNNPTFRKKSIN